MRRTSEEWSRIGYTEEGYIDWPRVMSYEAPYNLIIDARTRGKTYGLRKYALRQDYVRRHKRYVELTRTKSMLEGSASLQAGYFARFESDYCADPVLCDYLLKTEGRYGYVAKRPEEGKKPQWDVLSYFIALTDAQETKNRSTGFKPVKRFIFDEAIIDRSLDNVHDYLPGEIEAVSSIITSVTRERPDTPRRDRSALYLLGNACDLTCPWLAHFGITEEPPVGFSWHYDKRCLVWYGPPSEEWGRAMDATVGGALIAGTDAGEAATRNRFANDGETYYPKQPKGATFDFGIAHQGHVWGVWLDWREGYYYVVEGLPKSLDGSPVYALTAADARPNYVLARRAQKSLEGFADLYYLGIVRYQNRAVKGAFLDAMRLYGIR